MKVQTMIEALGMPNGSTQEQITEELNRLIALGNNIYAGWTLEDFLEKDPKALNELIASSPDKFEKINAEYFEGAGLSDRYKNHTKKQLQKNKEQMMQQTPEEREEFKERYPKEYDLIMNS